MGGRCARPACRYTCPQVLEFRFFRKSRRMSGTRVADDCSLLHPPTPGSSRSVRPEWRRDLLARPFLSETQARTQLWRSSRKCGAGAATMWEKACARRERAARGRYRLVGSRLPTDRGLTEDRRGMIMGMTRHLPSIHACTFRFVRLRIVRGDTHAPTPTVFHTAGPEVCAPRICACAGGLQSRGRTHTRSDTHRACKLHAETSLRRNP